MSKYKVTQEQFNEIQEISEIVCNKDKTIYTFPNGDFLNKDSDNEYSIFSSDGFSLDVHHRTYHSHIYDIFEVIDVVDMTNSELEAKLQREEESTKKLISPQQFDYLVDNIGCLDIQGLEKEVTNFGTFHYLYFNKTNANRRIFRKMEINTDLSQQVLTLGGKHSNRPQIFGVSEIIQPTIESVASIGTEIYSKQEQANKDTKGKTDWAMLDENLLEEVVEVFELGAIEYGKWNYRKGHLYSKIFSAIRRHLKAWYWNKQDYDVKTGKHHLSHVVANCMMLLHTIKHCSKEFDDRA